MLTAFQCATVAYTPEDFYGDNALCPDCFENIAPGISETETYSDENEAAEAAGYSRLDRYSAEESFSCYGLTCAQCGAEIVEADHSWLEAGGTCGDCGYEADEDEPEEHDPNPPVARWVPCSCGAGDGERHRDGCQYNLRGGGES